jgi:small subunit ribosomal protein S1
MRQSSNPFDPSVDDPQLDFADLLEQSFEPEKISRGDILKGTVLAIDRHGVIVDVGMKRDGVVPRSDIESLDDDHPIEVGEVVTVMVLSPEDKDGNLLVSIQQAYALKDWDAAQEQMNQGEVYTARVIAANRGGLILPYGELRGFIPASHVLNMPRGMDDDERTEHLAQFIGQEIQVKIIEVNPRRRRLVLSQREAHQDNRNRAKEKLMATLKEGDIVTGRVSSLRDFGAFIDLGGADGLVHVSELAWRRIRHPSEVLNVGMEVETYVLQLDKEGNRIGLSIKRLQPNPWVEIEENYTLNQLVEGKISRIVQFGAFVELENGIEALLHTSQMDDPPPDHPEDIVSVGEQIIARIITLEPRKQRMGLSLKGINDPEASENGSIEEQLVEADTV